MKLAVVALGTKQYLLPRRINPARGGAAQPMTIAFLRSKAGDLPAQVSVKFEFVGLDVQRTVLKLADEVINEAWASCAAVCNRQDAGSGFVRRTRHYRTIA
jgi:hypothetical protein